MRKRKVIDGITTVLLQEGKYSITIDKYDFYHSNKVALEAHRLLSEQISKDKNAK